jgi:DNA-binding LacI/PurR family transcriptional regulator
LVRTNNEQDGDMGVTIKDVAKRAGVAHGTVSRFINGHKVGEEKKQMIEHAIEELDYKVNHSARGLKSNKTHTVGILVRSLVDFFDTSIVTYIEDYLERNDYCAIICDYSCDEARFSSKLEFLLDRAVDGIIIFTFFIEPTVYSELVESKIPFVLIDSDVPGLTADKVFSDHKQAAFNAVERLIQLGHRDIAIINDVAEDNLVAKERLNGYYSALRKHNISILKEYLSIGSFRVKCGYNAAVELLKLENRPTAIFPANYYMALGAVAAIQEFGLKIPEDISIISFDFFERYDIVNTPLTCVVQPVDKIGNEAAAILLRRMKNNYSDFPQVKKEKTHILYRKSEAAVK